MATHRPTNPRRLPGGARTKLNLGCGTQLLHGWINVDHPDHAHPRADEAHDLDEHPWPWPTGSAQAILLDNVLEHLWDTHAAITEIYRLLSPDGKATIIVPHRDSPSACQADHKHLFDQHSLNPYIENAPIGRLGTKARRLFTGTVHVYHRHPWAWHQRRYLGRELLAWAPQKVRWDLQRAAGASP